MSEQSTDGWEWQKYMRNAFDGIRRSRDEAFVAQHWRPLPSPDPDWREAYRGSDGSLPDFPFEPGPVGRGGPELRDHRPSEVDPGVWRQQMTWEAMREQYTKYFGPDGSNES